MNGEEWYRGNAEAAYVRPGERIRHHDKDIVKDVLKFWAGGLIFGAAQEETGKIRSQRTEQGGVTYYLVHSEHYVVVYDVAQLEREDLNGQVETYFVGHIIFAGRVPEPEPLQSTSNTERRLSLRKNRRG